MSSNELENLVKIGKLKRENPSKSEIDGLRQSAEKRLHDANDVRLSLESRFDLAYNAAHAFSLAALRQKGYRSENRYIVFQLLPTTLGIPNDTWRVLDKCHSLRNLAEYEGFADIDETIVTDLIAAATEVQNALRTQDTEGKA
jgi:hypothetical protein